MILSKSWMSLAGTSASLLSIEFNERAGHTLCALREVGVPRRRLRRDYSSLADRPSRESDVQVFKMIFGVLLQRRR